jgi:hypothetical protein
MYLNETFYICRVVSEFNCPMNSCSRFKNIWNTKRKLFLWFLRRNVNLSVIAFGSWCHELQSSLLVACPTCSYTMKMRAVYSNETSVNAYRTKRITSKRRVFFTESSVTTSKAKKLVHVSVCETLRLRTFCRQAARRWWRCKPYALAALCPQENV